MKNWSISMIFLSMLFFSLMLLLGCTGQKSDENDIKTKVIPQNSSPKKIIEEPEEIIFPKKTESNEKIPEYPSQEAKESNKTTVIEIPRGTTCSESDTGLDIFVKGEIKAGSEVFSDFCRDGKTVSEYYCDKDTIQNVRKICPDNYDCKDGACTKSKILAPCNDSDGIDYSTKGNVTTVFNEVYEDVCVGRDNLREYYCENSTIKSILTTCTIEETCNSGRCLKNQRTCIDTDNGKDEYKFGQVNATDTILTTTIYEDLCYSDRSVKEYYCLSNNQVNFSIIGCPSDKHCNSGVCVSSQ